jgi:putative phosphoesterase
MRIGLIGDIHSNLPALEAVMTHAAQNGVQLYWNIGDFVGYNAFPEEVVQYLRVRDDTSSIVGNYDLKVLSVEKKRQKWSTTKDPDKLLSFEWTFNQLSPSSREYLGSLPKQRNLTVNGWQVLLVHGSPESIDEHLLPDAPEERLKELADMTPAQIIICGHSHHAFTRKLGETWFINTGSVGRPDDGDPRAAYAVLNLEVGSLTIDHYRLSYDVERAVAGIQDRGLPEEFAKMIRSGHNLAAVKANNKK